MVNQNKQQLQRLLHVGSVFVAVTLVAIFFILGGGSDASDEVAVVQEEGLNTELPEAATAQLQTNKLDLIEQEQRRILAERENENRQNNSSFDLMGNLQENEAVAKRKDMMGNDVATKIDPTTLEVKDDPSTPATAPASVPAPSADRMAASSPKTNSRSSAKRTQSVSEDEYEARARARMLAKEEEKRKLRVKYGLEKEEENAEKAKEEAAPVVAAAPAAPAKKGGFRKMGETGAQASNTLRAVVHGEQKNITTASQVKLRLLDATTINGTTIPKNTIVYGKASFTDNRMAITIDNIRYGTNLYPFKAEIYDMDGSKGLYVPDNVVNETKKDASSGAISNTRVNTGPSSLTPSGLINTAVNATSGAIQNASQKKVREVKVDLPANYKLLIKTSQDKR